MNMRKLTRRRDVAAGDGLAAPRRGCGPDRGIAVGLVLLAVCAAPAPAEPKAAAEGPVLQLRAADVLALQKRFGEFSDALPEASQLGMGAIAAFEESKLFICVVGDAPAAAPAWRRRVIFLKPSTFIVDDEVRPVGLDRAARWRLESRGEPRIDGQSFQVREGEMEIVCRTLRPDRAAPRVLSPARPGSDAAGGMVEVASRGDSAGVRLLHVLHIRGAGETSEAAARATSEDDGLHVTVSTDGKTFDLTLPPPAADAGWVAVSGADGKVLLPRRPLAAGVLPHGTKGVALLERWDSAYRGGRTAPWDTGRPSTELKRAVEDGTIRPGRAVILGCGTGTNAVYLASKGFDVTAIDVAPTALVIGEAKARKAGVTVRWLVADVFAPPALEPFDFIFDRGCYHGLRGVNAAGYVETVRRLSKPGTLMLLIAGNANESGRGGPPRVKEEHLRGDFSADFEFRRLGETRFDTRDADAKGALAWSVLLRRKDAAK